MSAEALSKIYLDPNDPGFLGNVKRLLRRARQLLVQGSTWQTVPNYHRSEQAYTLNKSARRRFTKDHTYVAGIGAQLQDDLPDIHGITRENGEMKYLLTVIDVFFKFAWAIPVHSEDAKAITAAFGQLLTVANPCNHRRLQTDKGTKFFNLDFQVVMKRHNI